MNSKYTILIDMDDTIEDLVPAWVTWLNAKYNLNVDPNRVYEWEMTKVFPELTKQQIREPLSLEDFWKTVKPKPDAIKYIQKLIEDGYKIKIVTASYYNTLTYKVEHVLFKYFPFIMWEDVIVCYDKSMIKGTCLIDDAFHNLIGFSGARILMDSTHNRIYDERKFNMLRMFGWEGIYNYIREMYK